jgi:signal transduction histidine kinase
MSRRRSLFSKYTVYFASLVTIILLASGLLEALFSYRENEATLRRLQRQQVVAASDAIEQFVREIGQQIAWASPPTRAVTGSTLDQRRDDYFRLLRQAPAITQVAYLDDSGKEQLRLSRLTVNVEGSGEDYSGSPQFLEARPWSIYYSPVYFRKNSEPYMTVAMAVPTSEGGVTVAEVNLKLIWDTVSQLRIGRDGDAFVVDGQGRVIAHRDLTIVLRMTDASSYEQIRTALRQSIDRDPSELTAIIADDLTGRRVLTSYAFVQPPGWFVFVEQPLEEAFEPLYSSAARSAGLLIIGIGLSLCVSLVLVNRLVTPIQALRRGAASIGAGALHERIQVHTGDELESLAEEFNRMAERLDELYMRLEQRVTERTRELAATMRQLEVKSRDLEIASRHKSAFVANMSHELRTPLNIVIGFSEVLLQQMFGPVNEKQEEYLNDIVDSGRHLLDLINDILDWSSFDLNHLELKYSVFMLPDALESTAQLLRETASRRSVELQVAIADDVAEIEADIRRLRQVLFNLLSNALKFTPAGGRVSLTARLEGQYAQIAVTDTGIGIPLEDQPRIFEPFEQSNAAAAQTSEGTGLGLAITKILVERHGGSIWLESAPGSGSSFIFTIPLWRPRGLGNQPEVNVLADHELTVLSPVG